MLIAGMVGFNSCGDDEVATPNAGTENPETGSSEDDGIDEEAAPGTIKPISTGEDGTPWFSASYFDNRVISMGYGFHINYPQKVVDRSCFTSKSLKQELRKTKEGVGLNIKEYYTSNDYQYKTIIQDEISGSIGFLSAFELNDKWKNTLTTTTSENTERLIFVVTYDLGQYQYSQPLTLNKEAYSYLIDNDFDSFKELYGTHYVYGCQKMASIIIEIEKHKTTGSIDKTNTNTLDGSVRYKGVKADFEWNKSKNSFSVNSRNDITVKFANVQGFSTEGIEDYIYNQANEKEANLVENVHKWLNEALGNIDTSKCPIYQYYTAPFTKYGCDEIVWTKKKENAITSISDNYIKISQLESMISRDLTKNNTADVIFKAEEGFNDNPFYTNILDNLNTRFDCDFSDEDKSQIDKWYQDADLSAEWQNLKEKVKTTKLALESQYETCNDIKAIVNNTVDDYSEAIEDLFDEYNDLYKSAFMNTLNIYAGFVIADLEKKEANKASIFFYNNSSAKFRVEVEGPDYVEPFDINGGDNVTKKITPGTYKVKATQLNGYLFYPTVVEETIVLEARSGDYFPISD